VRSQPNLTHLSLNTISHRQRFLRNGETDIFTRPRDMLHNPKTANVGISARCRIGLGLSSAERDEEIDERQKRKFQSPLIRHLLREPNPNSSSPSQIRPKLSPSF
jgi:hypothetical protein